MTLNFNWLLNIHQTLLLSKLN